MTKEENLRPEYAEYVREMKRRGAVKVRTFEDWKAYWSSGFTYPMRFKRLDGSEYLLHQGGPIEETKPLTPMHQRQDEPMDWPVRAWREDGSEFVAHPDGRIEEIPPES